MERVEGTCGAEAVTGRTGTGMPCTGSTAQRRAVGSGGQKALGAAGGGGLLPAPEQEPRVSSEDVQNHHRAQNPYGSTGVWCRPPGRWLLGRSEGAQQTPMLLRGAAATGLPGTSGLGGLRGHQTGDGTVVWLLL